MNFVEFSNQILPEKQKLLDKVLPLLNVTEHVKKLVDKRKLFQMFIDFEEVYNTMESRLGVFLTKPMTELKKTMEEEAVETVFQ